MSSIVVAGTIPAASIFPAASAAKVFAVASLRAGGTAAFAFSAAIAAPRSPTEGARPRRASLLPSRARPRARRLCTVPIGQPSCLRRLLLGQALEAAKHDHRAIALGQAADFLVEDRGEFLTSCVVPGPLRWLGRGPLVSTTPCPGRRGAVGDSERDLVEPGAQRIPDPERAGPRSRTRNVAWKASRASCSSRRTDRQTRSTIGPCRSSNASKAISAASPPRVVYFSSN